MKRIKTLFNLTISRLHLFQHLKNKFTYRYINIEPSAVLNTAGELTYGRHCSINAGATILVPKQAKLILGSGCYIGRQVELGPTGTIKIGDFTSLQDRCVLVGDIEIGRYCLFSLNVLISSGTHCFNKAPHLLIRDQDEMAQAHEGKKVVIEDDCWIGVNVVIMPGVKIGKGSIIGANAVVTKDIPPYSVAVGAPAKVVKKRLAFCHPKEINHANEMDYPYFYSGFEISALERRQLKDLSGLVAKNKFELALNTQEAKKIYLKIKSLNGSQILIHDGQQCLIDDNFKEVCFELNPGIKNLVTFQCQTNAADSKLVLQKAWVV